MQTCSEIALETNNSKVCVQVCAHETDTTKANGPTSLIKMPVTFNELLLQAQIHCDGLLSTEVIKSIFLYWTEVAN